MTTLIRIGTRASKLALAQAQMVQQALMAAHRLPAEAFELVPMTTAGDKDLHKNPEHWGYKGLFTKELEDALLEGRVDLAVHSMKDMPSVLPDGLMIAAMLERADVRDAWVSRRIARFEAIPAGAVIGTSSARRTAQLLHRHPNVTVVPLRGNVQTRLKKIDDGVAEATFLACAGLARLGLNEWLNPIETDQWLPAAAQGAIGIECRENHSAMRDLIAPLDHAPTSLCVEAERAYLRVLDGSCRTPIAGLAVLEKNFLWLRGEVFSLDGKIRHAHQMRVAPVDAIRAGEELGRELRAVAGDALLHLS